MNIAGIESATVRSGVCCSATELNVQKNNLNINLNYISYSYNIIIHLFLSQFVYK